MRDYTTHYRADADLIVDPSALSPERHASESRRLEGIVRHLGLRPGERLLDLGCGSGWLAAACGAAGASVIACDVAPQGVAAAKNRYPEAGSFLACDAYAVGLRSSELDVIVLFGGARAPRRRPSGSRRGQQAPTAWGTAPAHGAERGEDHSASVHPLQSPDARQRTPPQLRGKGPGSSNRRARLVGAPDSLADEQAP